MEGLAKMTEWEHATAVLRFKEKAFAMTRKEVVQGMDDESAMSLAELGKDGWELVAVLPFSSGSAGLFSNSQAKTDAAIAFFKRPVE
jgi:hypothetical protein